MRNLYEMLIGQDLSPKLIGKFGHDTKVVCIEIFDENGIKIDLNEYECDPIGTTYRWSWSVSNLPPNIKGKLIYEMTSDLGEVFLGDFTKEEHDDND